MRVFLEQTFIFVGVLAACLVGPALGIAFLAFRKRRARARRRSPIGTDLLRGPGHTLREQLDEASIDLQWEVFVLMAIPLMTLAVFLGQGHLRGGLQTMTHLAPLYVVLILVFVGFTIWKLWKVGERLDNLKAGFDAELAAGQELDQLMRRGAIVFHDVPANHFNVDHVVISGEGVYAVETKGFTKPRHGKGKADATVVFDGKTLRFPTWTTKDPLEQTQRQAAWLTKWLTGAVGTPIRALPILVLPGWYVERTGRGDVRVLSGKELAGLLKVRGGQVLTTQDVQRVAHQVEQRCRTVAPKLVERAQKHT